MNFIQHQKLYSCEVGRRYHTTNHSIGLLLVRLKCLQIEIDWRASAVKPIFAPASSIWQVGQMESDILTTLGNVAKPQFKTGAVFLICGWGIPLSLPAFLRAYLTYPLSCVGCRRAPINDNELTLVRGQVRYDVHTWWVKGTQRADETAEFVWWRVG